jgi:hypothetical protein
VKVPPTSTPTLIIDGSSLLCSKDRMHWCADGMHRRVLQFARQILRHEPDV